MKAPPRRPGETPQKGGRRFENFWAKVFGREPTKGSGNVWYVELDVGDGTITWECKLTDAESYSITKKLFSKMEGEIKSGSIPGLATAVNGEVFCTLRAEDLLRLLGSDAAKYVVPSKGDQKRNRSKIPALLREEN